MFIYNLIIPYFRKVMFFSFNYTLNTSLIYIVQKYIVLNMEAEVRSRKNPNSHVYHYPFYTFSNGF